VTSDLFKAAARPSCTRPCAIIWSHVPAWRGRDLYVQDVPLSHALRRHRETTTTGDKVADIIAFQSYAAIGGLTIV